MANMAMPVEVVAVDYLAYGTTGEDSERLPFLRSIHFAVVLVLPFALFLRSIHSAVALVLPFARMN